ncbi:TDT family transporter [Thalassotalea sp. PLHSN55]|uniref:TDT family transporter n=1 Tax=Thalassotalea sp. PLHSN55 TaxID=3435888 RepID=UPI003F86701A
MLTDTIKKLAIAPTPMAGLALGISSLGLCWQYAFPNILWVQYLGAAVAAMLLLILSAKFIAHGQLLADDLRHPVVGSVTPTFAMALMVVSVSVHDFFSLFGEALWLVAIVLHLSFLTVFIYHRAKDFQLSHMVPSWFIPPIGIIVAANTFPSLEYLALAKVILWFGIGCFLVMFPMMLYRIIFHGEIADPAKPTLAILAAPASLSLAGYLTVYNQPSPLVVALLLGIAVLMTGLIYLSFIKLLRLPFSPAYAAFTFPMVISALALFKVYQQFVAWDIKLEYSAQIYWLADIELVIATGMVGYVAYCYFQHFIVQRRL